MPPRISLRQRRKEIYLVAGIILGISIMATPAALYWIFGYKQPIYSDVPGEFFGGEDVTTFFRGLPPLSSPLDAFIEAIWLIVPGFVVVVILYLFLVRRRNWAGYDECVKWVRS